MTGLVKKSVEAIGECGFEVDLRWVPGHRVVGDRMADNIARRERRFALRIYAAKKCTWLIWPGTDKEWVVEATPVPLAGMLRAIFKNLQIRFGIGLRTLKSYQNSLYAHRMLEWMVQPSLSDGSAGLLGKFK